MIPPPAPALPDGPAWFRRLVDALPVIVWTATPDGRLDFLNALGREYTGTDEPDKVAEAVHPDDLPGLRGRWLAALPRRDRHEGRCRLRRAQDGAWRWHVVRAVPVLDDGGDVLLWMGALIDDHEARKLMQANQELVALEQRARLAADDANRMKDEFLATLGHELRTPLNAIAGWTNLLKRGLAAADVTRAIEVIERNTQVQRQLIDDLLDASRVLSGHVRLDLHPVALQEIMTRAVATIVPVAEAQALTVETEMDPSCPPVQGDAMRLQQVFEQLLANAVKFTPRDGHIHVRLWHDGDDVHGEVRDSGVGVAAAALPFLFDRARPADAAPDRRQGGLGLGLALVRQLVELHGGRVAASSAGPGTGTTVTVSFPAGDAAVGAHTPLGIATRVGEDAASALRGLSILVIEDDADSREMLSVLLENVGAVPVAAATVNDGVRLLGDLEIDVVVSDIGMPGRDGFDLIRTLRSFPNPRVRMAPALAVTAFTRPEDRERILTAGFDAHVSKPVEPRELFAAIADVFRRRRADAGASGPQA